MATAVTETAVRPAIDPAQHLAQLATGYQISSCIYTAAFLNIADLLASGPRRVEDLASESKTNADRLYRVLRALVSVGIFTEPQPRIFALSPPAELLRSDTPNSRRGFILFTASPFVVHVNSHLLHSVQTGQPAVEHLHGKPAFECFSSMPEVAFSFHEAMTSHSAALAPGNSGCIQLRRNWHPDGRGRRTRLLHLPSAPKISRDERYSAGFAQRRGRR